MARDLDVEVPLTDAVYALLYENKPIREIAESLFRRTPNVEFYGLK
jgi:glycerol-3-phosphate dehydrogenase (NAD(P)+)